MKKPEEVKQRILTEQQRFKTSAYDFVIMKLISCEEEPSLMASVLINNLADMISQTKNPAAQLEHSINALKIIVEKRIEDLKKENK